MSKYLIQHKTHNTNYDFETHFITRENVYLYSELQDELLFSNYILNSDNRKISIFRKDNKLFDPKLIRNYH